MPDSGIPLPERMRPRDLSQYVGQRHLVGPGCILRNMIDSGNLSSFILWGPPGVGKTTLASIIAHTLEREFYTLSAVSSGVKDVRDVIDKAKNKSLFSSAAAPVLFIDEIHKYRRWSLEIKEIYDLYKELHIILSGSSLIQINDGETDLSRRMLSYDLPGLSLREYINLKENVKIESTSLSSLLSHPNEYCSYVKQVCHPLEHFSQYLQKGYYPYLFEGENSYYDRIENVINYVIDVELTKYRGLEIGNTRNIKALLQVITQMVPYEVDIAKLSRAIGISRTSTLRYLRYLEECCLVIRLFSDLKTITDLQKPDKIYLDNTNLLFSIGLQQPDTGTIRETFFANQVVSSSHYLEYAGYKKGDFKIDSEITVEVGGSDKDFEQISGQDNGYIAADNINSAIGKKIPLWAFGFLY